MKHLKLCMLLLVVTLFSCNKPAKDSKNGISIVPMPNQMTTKKGHFTITNSTKLVLNSSSDLVNVKKYLTSRLATAAGVNLEVAKDSAESNFISIEVNPKLKLADEAYTLSSTKDGVTIKASTDRGAFYGVVTLVQLLPANIESKTKVVAKWEVPFVEITDAPRFKWRGMHLDVCRHFVSVEFIKRQLDVLAMYKINTFHWHLTEDQGWRIEIKKYPKLTEIGSVRDEGDGTIHKGFYTQEQIKDIVAYAAERYIDVVPEIELPGHALAAIVAYPYLACNEGPFKVRNLWGVEADVYCAGKESTFKFLEDVIEEVVALFPSKYFHIGGDECPKTKWEKCPLCQKRMKDEGLKNEHELQSYVIKRVEKVLIAHGKTMIGWDEILEGGLAPSAVVMSWRGEEGGITAANAGHDVIMTPGNWVYLDHYQGSSKVEPVAIGGYTTLEESYSYDPIPAKIEKDKAKHILGTQGNVWSEYMYTEDLFEYRIYPRIIALAEVNWTELKNKSYADFTKRMETQYVRLDNHNINYHIPLPEGQCNKIAFIDEARLDFTTTRPMKMVYTTNGDEPTLKSEIYKGTLIFNKNTTLKIRTALVSGKLGHVRTISINKETYAKGQEVKTTNVGLKYSSTRKLAKNEKVETVANMLEIHKSGVLKDDNAVHTFEGYIEIEKDGIYTFNTEDDILIINGKELINNQNEVKRFSRHDAQIALGKGKHSIKVIIKDVLKGGWPTSWITGKIFIKGAKDSKFKEIKNEAFSF